MAGETIDEARTEEREEALPVPLPVAVKAGPYEAGRTAERNPFGLARVLLTVDPRCMSRAPTARMEGCSVVAQGVVF